MIVALAFAAVVGNWKCTDSYGQHWVYTFATTGQGTSSLIPSLGTQSFTYRIENGYLIMRELGPPVGNSVRFRIQLHDGRMKMAGAEYWHDDGWTAFPSQDYNCMRT